LSSESSINSDAPLGGAVRRGVFSSLAFTVILVASSASNVGFAMFDMSSNWLMTSLNPDPMMVSAVQIATTLPMFLLTLPAGALTDIIDARRMLIGAQVAVTVVSIVFAALVAMHWATPAVLLAATFLLGGTGALAAPAWLVVTPMLVPKRDLDSAIAINNASYNVSRAIGPALGGLAIATVSIAMPFWCFCVGNVAVLAALIWWRAPRRSRESLPAERLFSALRTGLRYAKNNRDIDATIIRALGFFLFASAYWALLPLVARVQIHNGPEVYGVLLGAIGMGSILGSFALNRLKALLGPDRLATLGTLGTILALGLYGAARDPWMGGIASLIAGASWITMMTTLFVSAQVALPEWVRGRGLAIFLTAYFGAMTLGSAVWGKVASVEGLSNALYLAAAGAAIGMALTARWRLQTAAALDLTPSMHWRTPVFVHAIEDDQGPILVTVEYQIDPKDIRPFLKLMHEIGLERKRDGAYAWGVFEDTQVGGRIVETFLIQSLLELKHLRTRVTKADRIIEEQAGAFLKGPRKVTFLVAPKRQRHKRRKRSKAFARPRTAREPAPAR
jgi:predicted MFS family arabinose efflux permease